MHIKLKKITHLIILMIILFTCSVRSSENANPSQMLFSLILLNKSVSANYELEIYDNKEVLKDSSFGIFKLLRPSFLMLKTTKPFDQTLILNENKFLQYDPDIEQVIIKEKTQQMNYLSNLLLMNRQDTLNQKFIVSLSNIDNKSNKNSAFLLKPKSDKSTFEKININFKNKRLSNLKIIDNFGTIMVLNLKKIDTDFILTKDDFEIEAADNIEIIYQ